MDMRYAAASPNSVFAVRFAHPNAPSGNFANTQTVSLNMIDIKNN